MGWNKCNVVKLVHQLVCNIDNPINCLANTHSLFSVSLYCSLECTRWLLDPKYNYRPQSTQVCGFTVCLCLLLRKHNCNFRGVHSRHVGQSDAHYHLFQGVLSLYTDSLTMH